MLLFLMNTICCHCYRNTCFQWQARYYFSDMLKVKPNSPKSKSSYFETISPLMN